MKNIFGNKKARIDWLKLEDSNTKYFHAYAKVRQNAKAIHRLERAGGTSYIGQVSIKQEIRNFYLNLMGTVAEELTMVDKVIMHIGPSLTC